MDGSLGIRPIAARVIWGAKWEAVRKIQISFIGDPNSPPRSPFSF